MAQFTHFWGVKFCFKILTTRTTKTITTMIAMVTCWRTKPKTTTTTTTTQKATTTKIGYLLANDAIILLNLVDSPSVAHLGKISWCCMSPDCHEDCDKQTMTMLTMSRLSWGLWQTNNDDDNDATIVMRIVTKKQWQWQRCHQPHPAPTAQPWRLARRPTSRGRAPLERIVMMMLMSGGRFMIMKWIMIVIIIMVVMIIMVGCDDDNHLVQ